MGDVLVRLDVLASFSEVAATAPKLYVHPVQRDEVAGMVMLDQVRHPCLEVLDGMSFIASNVSFKQVNTGCKKSAYTVPSCSSLSPQKPTPGPNVRCMFTACV